MDESNHAPRMVCEKDASDADIGTAIVHAGSPLDPLSGAVIPSVRSLNQVKYTQHFA